MTDFSLPSDNPGSALAHGIFQAFSASYLLVAVGFVFARWKKISGVGHK